MPPIRSDSVGFIIRFSSVLPWAVPISCTPRSAIVRAAIASSSVPISSMTITSGMWFSTASIMTACCAVGVGTCIRRARPIAGCGMSPSPAISLLVSTMTTRLLQIVGQHARHLAQHRRLADARAAEQQDAFAGLDQVADDRDRAVDGAADAAGQADDRAGAIADRGDAMQRALDAGAVVVAKHADPVNDMLDTVTGHFTLVKDSSRVLKSRLRTTPKIHDDFDQRAVAIRCQFIPHRVRESERQGQQHLFQVVDHLCSAGQPWIRAENVVLPRVSINILLASPAFRHRLFRLLNHIEPTTPSFGRRCINVGTRLGTRSRTSDGGSGGLAGFGRHLGSGVLD